MPALILRGVLLDLAVRLVRVLGVVLLGAVLVLSGFACIGVAHLPLVNGGGAAAGVGGSLPPLAELPPISTTTSPAATNTSSVVDVATLPLGMPYTAEAIVAEAMRWVNLRVPYLWGGCTTRGVDCSCFVLNVYAAFGVHVLRTTVQQIAADQPIAASQLQVGDTVFFNNTCSDCGPNPTHEGLVIDPAHRMMIDAGDPVQVESFDTPYWRSRYAGAGRPR